MNEVSRMSSNAKRMPEINLEDFERRLRAAGSAPGAVEDPLEELTRLVNTIASERPAPEDRVVEIASARPARPLPAAAAPAPAPVVEPELELEPEYIPEADPTPATLPASVTEPPLLRAGFEETPEPSAEGIELA